MESKQKIIIVTDSYAPQLNGVATTIVNTEKSLKKMGHEVIVIHPESFKRRFYIQKSTKISMPLFPYNQLRKTILENQPCLVHISTEASLGVHARIICGMNNISFSTSFHTKFPEYAHIHYKIPEKYSWEYFRWFHKKSRAVMTNSQIMADLLTEHDINNVRVWSKGVDLDIFKPMLNKEPGVGGKWLVYSGRVDKEKNLEAFLALDIPDTRKYVLGDGPMLETYRAKFPDARFPGAMKQKELADFLATCDVFVFPSQTDTFGLVMVEAMACGLPVAGYINDATKNLIVNGENGWMSDDLHEAVLRCFEISQNRPIDTARRFSWLEATKQFLEGASA